MDERIEKYLNVDDLIVKTINRNGRWTNEPWRIRAVDSGQAFKLENGQWWGKDYLVYLCHDFSNAETPEQALIAGLPAILVRLFKKDEYKDRKIKELEQRIKKLEENQNSNP